MSDLRTLSVWRKSHHLALSVHSVAKKIRRSDYTSLRSQMLRAAMSIPTNIVEGVGQKSGLEFGRFIRIALNSTSELEYHLIMARDFGVMRNDDFESLSGQAVEVRRMLYGLHRRVVIPRPKSVVTEGSGVAN